jgi:hypothetical protein
MMLLAMIPVAVTAKIRAIGGVDRTVVDTAGTITPS